MSKGPNRILIIVVAMIAVVAAAAGVLSVRAAPQQYDRSTPEGVVQVYLDALVDRDQEQAAELLATDSPCAVEDLDRDHTMIGNDTRVILRDAETRGDAARVDVEVVTRSGGLFDGGEWAEEHTFRLSREGSDWRITGVPWPMYACDLQDPGRAPSEGSR